MHGSSLISLGIRKKLILINSILLTAALLASSFAISEFIFIGDNIEHFQSNTDSLNQTIRNLIIVQIGIAVIAASVNAYSFLIVKSITKPILEASHVVKKISEGDLSVDIKSSPSNDEIGELIRSLHTMTDNLRQLVRDVRETSTNVANNARESAAATEELNSSVEEVSITVQQIANGSQAQAAELSNAKGIVENVRSKSSADGSTAAEKMSRIIELTNESSNKVRKLADKGTKITSVVETIRDIAEKTNLLALNAAIEAARAGESGRGFAVVADEVRRLAEVSSKSSEEIDELIQQIQEEIQTTVISIDSSAEEIEEGRQVVDLSLRALTDIGLRVEEVATVAEENATATDQASASVDQQTSATQEISISSQNTAALAEELERKVSAFKLSISEEITSSLLSIKELEKSKKLVEPEQKIKSNDSGLVTKVFSTQDDEDKTNDLSEFDQIVDDSNNDDKK